MYLLLRPAESGAQLTQSITMQIKNWISVGLLALFVISLLGCGEQKNVVNSSDKTGMTAQERKDKRGD